MVDLHERLRSFAQGPSPDLWPDIRARSPRPIPRPKPGSRLLAGAVALAVATAGFTLAIPAFRVDERGAEGLSPSPTEISPVNWRAIDIRVSAFPNAVAVGDGGVWVSAPRDEGSGAGDVVRIDPETADVVARIPVRGLPSWESGGGGMAVGLGSVWVTGDIASGGCCTAIVQQIDPATNKVVDVIDLGPGFDADVWVDDTGIWVLKFDGNHERLEVVRVEPGSHEVVAHVSVPGEWSQTVFGAGGFIWVTSLVSGEGGSFFARGGYAYLTRIDPGTFEATPTRMEDEEAWGFVGPGIPWVRVEGGIQRFDPASGGLSGDVAAVSSSATDCCSLLVSDGAGGAWAASADRGAEERGLWHVNRDGVIDAFGEIGREEVDAWGGVAKAFDPSTQTIWVVHYQDTVSRIDLRPT